MIRFEMSCCRAFLVIAAGYCIATTSPASANPCDDFFRESVSWLGLIGDTRYEWYLQRSQCVGESQRYGGCYSVTEDGFRVAVDDGWVSSAVVDATSGGDALLGALGLVIGESTIGDTILAMTSRECSAIVSQWSIFRVPGAANIVMSSSMLATESGVAEWATEQNLSPTVTAVFDSTGILISLGVYSQDS